jgi:hypothetical protein
MPSIPQSLLWISLVVLWLFVLVPMLINKRDTVRRTSDVALATRVLYGGAKSRLIRRNRPAAGHRHDPDWQSGDTLVEDVFAEDCADQDEQAEVADYDDAVREARIRTQTTRSVMVVAAVTEQIRSESDYLDVDVVDENSGALTVGTGVQAALFDAGPPDSGLETERPAAEPVAEQPSEPELPAEPAADATGADRGADNDEADQFEADGCGADEYEYVDDTSGLEAEEGPATPVAPRSNRQRRLESTTAAAVGARKYRFRRRLLTVMATLMVLTAVLSFTVNPSLWWSCGVTAGAMVLYLAYLRRQTRIEEQVRRRRQQRMARMRAAEFDGLDERGPEVDDTDFPTRLQRPGTVVLDIDDEDPVFEHLDEVAYSRRFDPRDLPRAAGQ